MPSSSAPKGQGQKPKGPSSGAPGKGRAATKAVTKAPAAPRRTGSRYTAPTPKAAKTSPMWVPVAMFTCLALGIVVIGGNYLQLLPGGEASNNFLIIGLVLLVIGFVLSTFYR